MPYARARTLRDRRRRVLIGVALALPSLLLSFLIVGVLDSLMDPPDWLFVGVLVAIPLMIGIIAEYRVGARSGEK